jgi:phosphatidylserine/phosphatidylglycerophosphate/cardiolipin synthase-like enzyme
MRFRVVLVLAFSVMAALSGASPVAHARDAAPPSQGGSVRASLQAKFSPWDDVEGQVIGLLGAARREVLVQAYSLTSRGIAAALIAAHRRGVVVRLLADRDQTVSGESTRIPEIAAAGVEVRIETRYAAAHNKVMVIDGESPDSVVLTGSYNWTWSAQNRNAENLLIIRHNKSMTRAYAANWGRHFADAVPYEQIRGESRALN